MAWSVDPSRYRRWVRECANALAASREDIDAINVFPIPDGDTGTNAWATFDSAAEVVEQLPDNTDAAQLMKAHARGLLLGARGNSGVILSELLRGVLGVLSQHLEPSGRHVAQALEAGSKAAWAAVAHPQAGTILSVADAAAAGAIEAADSAEEAIGVLRAALASAREALSRTPEQMELLAKAHVVDAGGRALVVVLGSVLGEKYAPVARPQSPASEVRDPGNDLLDPDGPAYEVMFLLDRADDDKVALLRAELDRIGDSLVVVGGDGLWNVHVHTDDAGKAIEAGIAAGHPFHIRVTHFAEQRDKAAQPRQGRAILSAVFGSAMAAITRDAGAVPLEFSRTAALTSADLSRALGDLHAEEIIILPNRADHLAAAEVAAVIAREQGARVAVIPTTVQVQALAALAVHDASAAFDDAVVAMSTAAGQVRHGAVTIALADGITTAGTCHTGDILGVVNGDFDVIGDDLFGVAINVLQLLDVAHAELVTIVTGADCPDELGQEIATRIGELHPLVDVTVLRGDQEKYPLFLAVE